MTGGGDPDAEAHGHNISSFWDIWIRLIVCDLVSFGRQRQGANNGVSEEWHLVGLPVGLPMVSSPIRHADQRCPLKFSTNLWVRIGRVEKACQVKDTICSRI
jgi:hypothetical protein